MNIRTFLDVATGHLTLDDAALLSLASQGPGTLPIDTMAYEYGWIVSTATLIDEEDRDGQIRRLRDCGLSDAFVSIAVHAGRKGCWLLRFDREEDLDPRLPIGGYGLRNEVDDVDDADRGARTTTHRECFDRFLELCARHGDDVESAALEFRRDVVDRERQRNLSAERDKPTYRICPDWGHYFAEGLPERTVRWVFDRRTWSLARLEIMDGMSATWRTGTDAECADLEESLVVANGEALTGDGSGWGCVDLEEFPLASKTKANALWKSLEPSPEADAN